MTTTSYVQLPPDGVGKKVRHRLTTDLIINTAGYTANVPVAGSTITGATSGATGILLGVYSADTTNYYLEQVSGTYQTGELVRTGAITYGSITQIVANVFTPSTSIVDPKVPEYTVSVAKASGGRGAALVQFPEFAPQFDAFGHMQVSQMLAVGEYYHFVQDLAGKYYTQQYPSSTNASVVHQPQTSSMIYTTDTTSGAIARRVTNQYHPYKPGVSQLILTSLSIGELRTNVVREWGYFDDYNGFGFRLDGSTLKVFLRSDSSGVVVDTEVPQSAWNVNTLLTDATSDMIGDLGARALNPLDSNIYWMDVQGEIGRIRLGVVTPDGRRIVCHEFNWTNTYPGDRNSNYSYLYKANGAAYTGSVSWATNCRNLNLPMQWAQRNTSTTGGSSTMRVGIGVVLTETADVQYFGDLMSITPPEPIQIRSGTNYQPFLSFKAKSLVNGLPNSIIGIHETFDWASFGNVNLSVGIFVVPSEEYLVGHQWSGTIQPQTMLYVDQNGTEMANYQFWGTSAQVTGSIGTGITINYEGNTSTYTGNLTVTSVSSGSILPEMYVMSNTWNPQSGLAGGAIADKTRIIRQLIANTSVATKTVASGGTSGLRWFTANTATNIYVGQLVSGTGIPMGTTVENVSGANVLLTRAFTTGSSGNYLFSNVGGVGIYQVNKSQTVGSGTIYSYYRAEAVESFVAPAGSAGRAALGDRILKSFGLGGQADVLEENKAVFVFGVKALGPVDPANPPRLHYTKFWKEIR